MAYFNLSSPPFRMKINQNLAKYGSNNVNHLTKMIPGMTAMNFSFSVLDYYNQQIMNLTFGLYVLLTISLVGFSKVNFINGFEKYIINDHKKMLNFQGECNFTNLKVTWQLRSKFYLAFTITELEDNINDDLLFLYDNKIQNNNEKTSENSYYFIVGILISDQCDLGQYYDNKKFWSKI